VLAPPKKVPSSSLSYSSGPQRNHNHSHPAAAAAATTPSLHNHTGGGLLKRTQGEYVKNFLAHMILYQQGRLKERKDSDGDGTTEWAVRRPSDDDMQYVRTYLNHHGSSSRSSGVLDVAGGSGHVSMALGLDGIMATIVDPRDKAGLLPGRDRKVWKRALAACHNRQHGGIADDDKDNLEDIVCQPIVRPYNVVQAWFGTPPEVRHDHQSTLPVCRPNQVNDDNNPASRLLRNCRAIIALHPDEATDAIVDTAIQLQIPFLIVPCCVFYRLFPHRRLPHDPTKPVSTYADLLDYLQAKHESIQRTILPFEGANTLLWSIFGKRYDT
jgi:hypothetical protein